LTNPKDILLLVFKTYLSDLHLETFAYISHMNSKLFAATTAIIRDTHTYKHLPPILTECSTHIVGPSYSAYE